MMLHADTLWTLLKQLREDRPLVHVISNLVAMTPVANALLAVGAAPIMAHAEVEVAEITAAADALVINLGTFEPTREGAIRRAMAQAADLGRPIILDPVGVAASTPRRVLALDLLATTPVSVLRGNAAEIRALAGETSTDRGVDSRAASDTALAAARCLGENRVVVVSGKRDLLVSRHRSLAVNNGHPLMSRVTAMGCIASALCGAFAAVESDPLRACAAAMATMGLAGERAGIDAVGPGSLAVGFVDALYGLAHGDLTRLRITPLA